MRRFSFFRSPQGVRKVVGRVAMIGGISLCFLFLFWYIFFLLGETKRGEVVEIDGMEGCVVVKESRFRLFNRHRGFNYLGVRGSVLCC